jgi:DNA modification methylase
MLEWREKQVSLDELKPFERNPRKISRQAFEKLKASLQQNGYHQRIIATSDFRVIGGHQRIKALGELGVDKVKVLVPDGEISDKQFKKMIVSDNLPFGEFDFDMLKLDYSKDELLDLGMPEDWLTGVFDDVETIDGLTDPDSVPEAPVNPVTVLGDVWLLGNHRVMCGDSTQIDAVEKLMSGQKADMLLTDPPYNVAYEGKTKKDLKIENDSMDDSSFMGFLTDAFICGAAVMKAGAVYYIWHADSEGYNFRGACKAAGLQVRQCLIWVKQKMVMGRQDYHWKHEPCLYGWKDGAAHLWATDRKQTTVLEFERPQRNGDHPTMKPVALFEYQMLNNTKGSDIVLDLFGGSGTTAIAAEKNGRHARLMELDPKYCDVIIKRWQDFTGKEAIHAETGNAFNVLAEEKAAA